MNAGILAFSQRGETLAGRIAAFFSGRGDKPDASRCPSGGLARWTEEHFPSDDALVFVSSCGIAVRAVAPHVHSKVSDPAVLAVDELGTFVIPLLSGHLGGANELARELAGFLGATAVITTATDINGLFAVDTWAKNQGLSIADPHAIKRVSSRLLHGQRVGLKSEVPVLGTPPAGVFLTEHSYDILISCAPSAEPEVLHLIPPVFTLGVGCRRGTPKESFDRAFSSLLLSARCHPSAIGRVCTIDLKADESGLLEFCLEQHLPLQCFSAHELSGVPGSFSSSEFVSSVTGVDNVCERSAVLGAGPKSHLVVSKTILNGVTMALAISPYSVQF